MEQQRKIVELKPFSTNDSEGLTAAVSCYYEIELIQNANSGIAFQLIVNNSSSQNVSLFNPLDYLKIDLQVAEGWPVLLPLFPSRLKVGDPANPEPVFPFKVNHLLSSEKGSVFEIVGSKTITLLPNEEYRYSLCIDKVQPIKDRAVFRQTTETTSLDSGTYALRVAATLMLITNQYKQCGSPFINIELI
jgi:hypothetical protein